jgi:UDP-3-O-[3-hydroxymyristoyl] glucosamine N-acyltransferase
MTAAARAYTLAEIVDRFGGELIGSPDIAIRQVATLQSAGSDQVAFLAQGRYRAQLGSTRAAAVILPPSERDTTSIPRILCEDPYLYFARVSALLNPPRLAEPGIHPGAVVEPEARVSPSAGVGPGCHIEGGAEIGDHVRIGAGCAIGNNCRIGEGSLLHPSVVVYAGCHIGKRAVIHSGAVIGADGFGMARDEGRWVKIPQIGGVVIGDDVEIGANTTIDRGALDDTVIEDGVKLDNQIQIGHNVRVGAHTAMAGCVGIAGSAQIGRHCTLGGGAIVLGHLELADRVHVSAGSLVMKSITQAGTYSGVFPLQENHTWARTAVLLRNIDEFAERVRVLERIVAGLQGKG